MKQIDRYIVRRFLVRLIAANLIIFGLYVSFDAVKRIDQIQSADAWDTIPRLLAYYAYQFPTRVLDTIAPLLLVAAGLALVQMSRDGELLVLKASGVSARRAALPVFASTLVVVVLVAVARESIVPWCFREHELLKREIDEKVAGPFLLRDPASGSKVFVDRYDFSNHTMSRVCLMDFYPDGGIRLITLADSGGWLDEGSMYLETVSIQQMGEKGSPLGKPTVLTTKIVDVGLTAYDFLEARRDVLSMRVPAMTLGQMRRRIRGSPDNPRFRVMFHSRLVDPLGPFVLLLIGVPLLIGFEHRTRSRVLGAVLCILVAAGFHVISFISISMGNTGLMIPVLAAWLPPVLAGAAGSWMFSTMRT